MRRTFTERKYWMQINGGGGRGREKERKLDNFR